MDCFDKILRFHRNSGTENFKLLIQLMGKLKVKNSNKSYIWDCVLFMINLCFTCNTPDYLFEQGKPLNKLNRNEKEKLREILIAEV